MLQQYHLLQLLQHCHLHQRDLEIVFAVITVTEVVIGILETLSTHTTIHFYPGGMELKQQVNQRH